MACDEKYRKRAVEYRKEGHTIEETSKTFKIGTSTLKTWVKKHDETGEIKDKPLERRYKKVDPIKLEKYIEDNPEAYLSEIAEVFLCSGEAIRQNLKKLKITRKKRRSASKSRTPKE